MAVKTLSIWEGVPDSERLREMLAVARDSTRPLTERQQAVSYLTGAAKVLASLEKRRPLAEYLRRQLLTIRSKLYYTEVIHEHG